MRSSSRIGPADTSTPEPLPLSKMITPEEPAPHHRPETGYAGEFEKEGGDNDV